MSRSNPTISNNPCTRYFEWNGETGKIKYYDKERKENVDVELPFTFLALDQLSKVSGWSQSQEKWIYSNEVKNLNKEVMTVKVHHGGVLAQGYYSEIKDKIKSSGARYNASVYIAFKGENGLEIGSLSLKGAALSKWLEFRKSAGMDLYEKAVVLHDTEEGQNGKVTYQMPLFKLIDTKPETDEQAKELDKQLQAYLEGRSTYPEEEISEPPKADEPPPLTDAEIPANFDDLDDDLPF
jgi:extradiol dioxygenase family protein